MRSLGLLLVSIVACADIALMILWLRPLTRRAWSEGGAALRATVSAIGLVQLLILTFCAVVFSLALSPAFGPTGGP